MGLVIAYVVSGTAAAGALTPVNTRTHAAGAPIVIGGGAQSIAVTPNGKTVYVPNGVLNTVTVPRTATNTLLPPIPVGGEPFAIVATPNLRWQHHLSLGDPNPCLDQQPTAQHSGWQRAFPHSDHS